MSNSNATSLFRYRSHTFLHYVELKNELSPCTLECASGLLDCACSTILHGKVPK